MKHENHPAQRIKVTPGTTGITIWAQNVVPYANLIIDGEGFNLHHGTASGGQRVHTVKSKINAQACGKYTVTIQLGNGGKMTIPAPDAEVAFAQLLPELAAVNKGASTTS